MPVGLEQDLEGLGGVGAGAVGAREDGLGDAARRARSAHGGRARA